MVRLLRQPWRRSVELLEVAVVLPLVLLLLFGLLEFGWMFLLAQQVTHAARHGARIGATADASNADVLQAVEAMLTDRGMGGLATVNITSGGVDLADLDSGETLTVEVSVPYDAVGLGVPLLAGFAPESLRASVSMAKEGP
jgi:Flp pilus assembly protein TadG